MRQCLASEKTEMMGEALVTTLRMANHTLVSISIASDEHRQPKGKCRHYDRQVNWCCTARDSAKSHKLLQNLFGLHLALVPTGTNWLTTT